MQYEARGGLESRNTRQLRISGHIWFGTIASEKRPELWLHPFAERGRELTKLRFDPSSVLKCHRTVENRPLAGTSKPATPRCFIHIRFLDSSKCLLPSFTVQRSLLSSSLNVLNVRDCKAQIRLGPDFLLSYLADRIGTDDNVWNPPAVIQHQTNPNRSV